MGLHSALFYQSTPTCLKVVWWWVVAHVIIVSAPVQRIGFLVFIDLVLTRDLLGQRIGNWTGA